MVVLYTDAITNDDLFSNYYSLKEVDGVMYEVDCNIIKVTKSDTTVEVVDLAHNYRLHQVAFDKNSYIGHVTAYFGSIKDYLRHHDPDILESFTKATRAYITQITDTFKDCQFYIGESMSDAGMVAVLRYREDGTPYMAFWKHGLKEITL